MKKRYHINPTKSLFSHLKSISNRAKNHKARQTSQGFSQNLVFGVKSEEKLAASSHGSSLFSQYEQEAEIKLEQEITIRELNGFAFSCLDSLASIKLENQTDIRQVIYDQLRSIVKQKLGNFKKLAQESKSAATEFKVCAAQSRKLLSSVKEGEQDGINAEAMKCAERMLCQKYRAATLNRRLEFLIQAIPDYVAEVGTVAGLPKPVLNKVSNSVRDVLIDLTK